MTCPRCQVDHGAVTNTRLVCEDCGRLIPAADLARFRCDALNPSAEPRCCEDCAETASPKRRVFAKPPVIRRAKEVST